MVVKPYFTKSLKAVLNRITTMGVNPHTPPKMHILQDFVIAGTHFLLSARLLLIYWCSRGNLPTKWRPLVAASVLSTSVFMMVSGVEYVLDGLGHQGLDFWRWVTAVVSLLYALYSPGREAINLQESAIRNWVARRTREIGFQFSPVSELIASIDGKILDCNPAASKATGYQKEDLLTMNVQDLLHPKEREAESILMQEVLARGRESYQQQRKYIKKDGSTSHVSQIVTGVFLDEVFQYFIVQVVDRNEEQKAIDLLHSVLQSTGDVVAILDRDGICHEHWEDGKISLFHCLFGGRAEGQALRPNNRILSTVKQVLEGGRPQQLEYKIGNKDGVSIYVEARITQIDRELALAIWRDITCRKKLEKRLRYEATHDELTGCYNRTYLYGATISKQRFLGGIYIDLTRFKYVNDIKGHLVGDLVLKEISARLMSLDGCIVCRDGGDEWFLLTNRSPSVVAQEVLALILEPVMIQGTSIQIGGSIGYANGLTDGSPENLRESAEIAMRVAKGQKDSTNPNDWICEWSEDLQNASKRQNEISFGLEQALERGDEVWLAYQPIVSLPGRHRVGVEALARWDSPVLGVVSPGEFVPIAESNGSVLKLTKWAMKTISKRLQEGTQPGIYVSMNITPWELSDTRWVELLLTYLQDNNINHEMIKLEVTERVISRDAERFRASLERFSNLKIGVKLDDFGVGESNLEALSRYAPFFETLKVDRQFLPDCKNFGDRLPEILADLEKVGQKLELTRFCQSFKISQEDVRQVAFFQAIYKIANGAGLPIVAEGVETKEQHEFLTTIGCQFGQGYYYGKPVRWEQL